MCSVSEAEGNDAMTPFGPWLRADSEKYFAPRWKGVGGGRTREQKNMTESSTDDGLDDGVIGGGSEGGSIVAGIVHGMVLLWLTTLFPTSRPMCNQFANSCSSPTTIQLLILHSSFALMSIGAGGIRSSSLAFGVDQVKGTKMQESKKATSAGTMLLCLCTTTKRVFSGNLYRFYRQ